MSKIIRGGRAKPDFPCPFCYAQEQGIVVGKRPPIRAWASDHDPVCLFRELVQYRPRGVSTSDWQTYLVEITKEIITIDRSPTERAKLIIEAAERARDVLPRYLCSVVEVDDK